MNQSAVVSGRAIGKQISHAAPLQIDEDRSVIHALSPSPLIDTTDDPGRGTTGLGCGAQPLQPAVEIVLSLTGMPRRASSRSDGSSTCAVSKQPDDTGKTGGPARKWRGQRRKPLSEDPTTTLFTFQHRQRVTRA